MIRAVQERVDRVLARLRGRRIHVVAPSGTEGSAVIDFLLGHGITTITGHDLAVGPEGFAAEFQRTHQWLEDGDRERAFRRLTGASIPFLYKDRYLEGIDRADVVVVPQSWFRHKENERLHEMKARVPFTSMTRLFFETCPCPIIGVTGTNGKFTVAMLIYEMLKEAGLAAFISGNDRTHVPMLYHLDQMSPSSWLVLEISNRQLVNLPYSPHVAVVTNVAPHHLDDHGSMEAYVAVKTNLVRHQGPGDHAVLNLDNAYTRAMAAETKGKVWWFSAAEDVERGAYTRGGALWLRRSNGAGTTGTHMGIGGERPLNGAGRGTADEQVMLLRDLQLPGPVMIENALAACAGAAVIPGLRAETMGDVLRRFRGFPYRFSYVGEVGGIGFFEDSLATNPSAAAGAIRALDRPFLLIAGGVRRGATPADFAPMVDALAASGLCKAVLLIGSTAGAIADAIQTMDPERRPTVVMAGTLEGAMAEAHRLAVDGDAVLLSPGCESFDQFADYRERGDRFRALIKQGIV